LQSIVAALEVLAETKLRMQRSTFGRALAELALVRISLLRDLDRLDELLAQVKGNSPVKAAPSPLRPSTPPASAEKKTSERPVEPVISAEPAESALNPPEVVWGPDYGAELLSKLTARFNDIVGTYLRQVVSTAIFGPNQLEFSFPAHYDLGRKACEKPEVLTRLE